MNFPTPTLMEFLTWKLAPIMGGRTEVRNSPLIELLEYWILEDKKQEIQNEKERSVVWAEHLSRKYVAQMTMINEKNEKDITKQLDEFEKLINPYSDKKHESKEKKKAFEWPSEDEFKKLVEAQEQGGAY